jgi:hypothetical protein
MCPIVAEIKLAPGFWCGRCVMGVLTAHGLTGHWAGTIRRHLGSALGTAAAATTPATTTTAAVTAPVGCPNFARTVGTLCAITG